MYIYIYTFEINIIFPLIAPFTISLIYLFIMLKISAIYPKV